MYDELNIIKTWACIKAMANSKPENAITNPSGKSPNIKGNIPPKVIILKVKPLKILSSICPENILAANLNPNEIFLAKYEINSINTNKGNNGRGQPDGTNIEKYLKL
jgi:hypothetical protein